MRELLNILSSALDRMKVFERDDYERAAIAELAIEDALDVIHRDLEKQEVDYDGS